MSGNRGVGGRRVGSGVDNGLEVGMIKMMTRGIGAGVGETTDGGLWDCMENVAERNTVRIMTIILQASTSLGAISSAKPVGSK